MDITKTLPTELKVENPNGRSFTQVVIGTNLLSYMPDHRTYMSHKENAAIKFKSKHGKQKMEWKQRANEKQATKGV
ncbi:hypothetical protein H5410_052335 [Solanum commersonii]|uniref:Uncharacterized protein n=1 Tax=Solanum commersonii TaxID=4109 RepID=A0A9J5X334_SOLCO|nr:hypothetical protein H5410_052335 [Solanum commersonii]